MFPDNRGRDFVLRFGMNGGLGCFQSPEARGCGIAIGILRVNLGVQSFTQQGADGADGIRLVC